MNHPLQPLVKDHAGVIRFKANGIVRFLLNRGPTTLNDIRSATGRQPRRRVDARYAAAHESPG